MFSLKITPAIGWLLILPCSILIYIVTHLIATLFFNLSNFMYPVLAYGKGFIDSVLAPGFAAYFSILLPVDFFRKNCTPLQNTAISIVDLAQTDASSLPQKLLIFIWVAVYGVLAGFGSFTSNWSSVCAAIVGLVVVMCAFEV